MQLKEIGNIFKALQNGKNFGDIKDSLDGLTKFGRAVTGKGLARLHAKGAIDDSTWKAARNRLGLDASDAANAASLIDTVSGKVNSLKTALSGLKQIGSNGLSAIASGLQQILSAGKGATNIFQCLWAILKQGGTMFMGSSLPIVAMIAAATVALKKAYDAAHEYENAHQKAVDSQSSYDSTISEIDTLNSKLDTTKQRLNELRTMRSNGTISVTDKAELDRLERENTELETKQKLLEGEAKRQQRTASIDAVGALKAKEQSQYMKEHGYETEEGVNYTDKITAVRQDLQYLDQLYRDRSDLEQRLIAAYNSGDTKTQDNLKSQLNNNEAEIEKYHDTLSKTMPEIEKYRDTLQQDTNLGSIAGGEQALTAASQLMNMWHNLGTGQTELEKTVSQLNTFFNSSSGHSDIQDAILSLMDSATPAAAALNMLGLSLEDLGVTETPENLATFNKFFKELKQQADGASDSVKNAKEEIDGTMSGIAAAMESENAGAGYEKLNKYLSTAKQLFDQGLVGTDDFKTVAKMIAADSADIETATKDFSKNYTKLQKYFTEDASANSGRSKNKKSSDDSTVFDRKGIDRFVSDLEKTGKTFKTTADAADALGISTGAFEVIMGRLKDYDITKYGNNTFDSMIKSAAAFEQAKENLSQLQTLYDNMDEGGRKDALGDRLSDWESQINKAQTDLKTLDTDIVLQMKLEYDLDSLQNEIDEARSVAQAGGGATSWAVSISKQQKYNQTAEHAMGIDREGIKLPVEYVVAKQNLDSLQEQLATATNNGDIELQAKLQPQVDSLGKLVGAFDDAMLHSDMKLTPELEIDEANERLSDWIQSEEGQKIVLGIFAENNASDMLNDVDNYKIADKHVNITVSDQAQEPIAYILSELSGIPEEKLIQMLAQNNASPDILTVLSQCSGIPLSTLTKLNAKDGASAVAAYVISSITGIPLSKISTLMASDHASTVAERIHSEIRTIPKSKTSTITLVKRTIKQFITEHFGGGGKPNNKVSGDHNFQGTAHAFGSWGLKKNQTSLINELGEEIIVRNGKWFTLNNGYPTFAKLRRGDIIFNHKQTEELLKNGYVTNSHARIFGAARAAGTVSGTAFATGTKKSKSSKNTSSDKTTIDWLEILLDRAERAVKKLTDKVGNTFAKYTYRLQDVAKAITSTQSEIAKQRKAQAAYQKKANAVKLSAGLKKQVREGAYYIYDYDEKTQKLINDYKEWYEKSLDAKDAIDELTESLGELAQKAFDIVSKEYANEFDTLENHGKLISGAADLAEARGYFVNSGTYTDLIGMEQRKRDKGIKQYNDLKAQLDKAVKSGAVAKFSEEWWAMSNDVREASIAIQECDVSIAEFQQKINDLNWEKFDYLQDTISKVIDESNFLIDLLEDSDLFTDSGQPTSKGWATIGLHSSNIKVYQDQVKQYAKAIQDVDKQLANDPYNKELISRRTDLYEAQQKAILAAKDEKKAISDLIEDGIDKQVDHIKTLIDTYTDALDEAKSLYDYQRKVTDHTQEIAAIRKQIAAYSGDESDESKARIQKLQVDLENAENDLKDTEYDKYVSDTKKLLDNFYTQYKEDMERRAEHSDSLVDELIGQVDSHSTEINNVIRTTAKDVGYTLSSSMSTLISDTNGGLTNITSMLQTISDYIKEMADVAGKTELNKNGDPVVNSNGEVQYKKWESRIHLMTGETRNIDSTKRVIFPDSDDTSMFSATSNLRPISHHTIGVKPMTYSKGNSLLSMPTVGYDTNSTGGNINIAATANVSIDHVSDYNDFVTQLQHDKQFESMIQSMSVDRLVGKTSLAKNKYNWRNN